MRSIGRFPLVLAALAAAASCSGSSGPGRLAVQLVDAPNPIVDQIVVNVTKVTAHSAAGGWVTVGPVQGPLSVDLLKLKDYAQPLGLVNLPAGKVTQIRLLLSRDGNYVVPVGSTSEAPLVVPSGYESGVKIVGPWNVPDCTQVTVTLDFDGAASLEYHEADGTWILRPVIRAKKVDAVAISCTSGEGAACSATVACPEGQVCTAGTCTPSTPGGAGSGCTAAEDCLSGDCTGGTCQPGGQGDPCTTTDDCQSTPAQLVCDSGVCAPRPL